MHEFLRENKTTSWTIIAIISAFVGSLFQYDADLLAGNLVINDGVGDLSYGDALEYATNFSLQNHDDITTEPHVTGDTYDALAGTDGVPSAANPFVTDSDPRLSVSNYRFMLPFSRDGSISNVYLKSGEVFSNLTGFRIIRDGTITGLSVEQNDLVNSPTIEIRKNDLAGVLASITIVGGTSGRSTDALSVAVSADDIIQVYCNGTSTSPTVLVEIYAE